MKDYRQNHRNRVLLRGRIVAEPDGDVVDCVINDLSDTGARISTQSALQLSGEFDFLIAKHQKIYRAKIVWQRANQLGLTFVGQAAGAA